MYTRRLELEQIRGSAFLFGPRMTGKTTLLNQLRVDLYVDLLDPELELAYRATPGLFRDQIMALPRGARVAVDEIQRVPALLDYAQMGIDRMEQRFLLSGSSARKLKRGGANLLGGRALDLRLHPLTVAEIGRAFTMEYALNYGTLPKIYSLLEEARIDEAKDYLRSYVTTYIKEEIQAEALTRNLGAFQRFLQIAAQSHGQVIEYANIARESAVPASTVKEYYQILEDTLLGFFLWPHDRNERKKARPKFYFFDCGVVRALQNRVNDAPIPTELGFLFEGWFAAELRRLRDYARSDHTFCLWRRRQHEVDIVVCDGHGPVLGIECKSGIADMKRSTVAAFAEVFPGVPLVVASLRDALPRRTGSVMVLPWQQALSRATALFSA